MVNFIEIKTNEGKWSKVGAIFPHNTFRKHDPIEFTPEPFDATNYDMYAIFGFAIPHRTSVKPVFSLKGLPDDSEYLKGPEELMGNITGETLQEWILNNGNCLNYSYLLVSELLVLEDQKNEYLPILGEGFFTTLDSIKKLGHPSDVRLVYWFA